MNKNHDARGRFSAKGAKGARADIRKHTHGKNFMMERALNPLNKSQQPQLLARHNEHKAAVRSAIDRLSPGKASSTRMADVRDATKRARASALPGLSMERRMAISNHRAKKQIDANKADAAYKRSFPHQVDKTKAPFDIKGYKDNRVTHRGEQLQTPVNKAAQAKRNEAQAKRLKAHEDQGKMAARIEKLRAKNLANSTQDKDQLAKNLAAAMARLNKK